MEKIPKDLSRWLKDNGHFKEFIRLVRICGYTVSNLLWKKDNDYGIKDWLEFPMETKYVDIGEGKDMRYDDFLDSLKLNWRNIK